MRQAIMLLAALTLVPAAAGSARADIFKLSGGGEIRGELANPDESPREYYVIAPYAGGRVKLAAGLVTRVVRQRPIEVEYEKERLTYDDTVDGQWKLAEWCRQNKLSAQAKVHLERVIALDPDHVKARKLLGYKEKVGDRWLTFDEIKQEEGRVKYKGSWLLPQQVEQIKEREKNEQVRLEWFARLSLWRRWLDTDKATAGQENILAIKDKAADKALLAKLKEEKDYAVRSLYVRALGNLVTFDAVKALVQLSLEDHRASFRETCLQVIEKSRPPDAFGMYVKALGNQDNEVVNRAAAGLARLGNKSAIAPLIDALITKHRFITGGSGGGGLGSISPTFTRNGLGGGGTGLGLGGGGPQMTIRYLRNADVLSALVKLTGQDFDYNVDAWKYWYASTVKRPPRAQINGRRD